MYFCQKYFSIFPYPLLTSLSSTRSLISPLDCLFVLLFPYSLDYVSGRPYLSAIIHAGHISYIFENTHTHTHTHRHHHQMLYTTTTTIKRVSNESLLDCPLIQHLCPESRTVSILQKQPYLERLLDIIYECVWDLTGHVSNMCMCIYLVLKIFGLKKKRKF